MKKAYRSIIALGALAVVCVTGGTWAYWTQELWAVNEFETGVYDTTITEEFTPPKAGEWLPGTDVKKEVKIQNRGDVDAVVAVRIHQKWEQVEELFDDDKKLISPPLGAMHKLTFPETASPLRRDSYAAQINWGDEVVFLESEAMPAALAEGLGVTVGVSSLSDASAAGKWVLVGAAQDQYGYSDLYFFYAGVLPKRASEKQPSETKLLLRSVGLNPKIETLIAKKKERRWYDAVTKQPMVEHTVEYNENASYEASQYTLTVDASTVQATASAIDAVWGGLWADDAGAACLRDMRGAFVAAFEKDLLSEYVDVSAQN